MPSSVSSAGPSFPAAWRLAGGWPPPPRLPSTLHPRELASSSTLYLSRPLRTAMAQRAAGGLLQRSLGLGLPTTARALSTSATTPAAAAEGEAAANARRNKKKNLFDVAQFLPDRGVGYRSPRPPGATSPTRSPRSTSTRSPWPPSITISAEEEIDLSCSFP